MQIDQNIFYEEFLDKIDSLDDSLKEIQSDFTHEEHLNEIFRALHTIKGTADLLGMFEVVTVVHKAEDLLDIIRNGKAQMDQELCNLYKDLKEYLNLCLNNIMNGVFDDPEAQNLAIRFEQEFSYYLQMAEEGRLLAQNKTILVVESTSINRYMIKKIANDAGFSAYICNNGVDAAKKIKDNDINLIFCDLNSDCERCKDFLENVKKEILYDDIPIVLLVDYFSDDIRKFAKKIGAKAWLKKPVEIEKLTGVLDKLLID